MSRLVFNIPREISLQRAKTVLYEMKIVGMYVRVYVRVVVIIDETNRTYVCIHMYVCTYYVRSNVCYPICSKFASFTVFPFTYRCP